MPTSQKIITKLRERRQIEADLSQMLEASSEPEFRRQAERIAAQGPQVMAAIVGKLDRADARMLMVMGAVATYLDREEAIRMLRLAMAQPERSEQGRVGAMTILERYLGVPSDKALLTSLADPETGAVSSLQTILIQAETDPSVLVEYVQGLDRQEPDVVLAVIKGLLDLSGSVDERRFVEPLRMMAQDVRGEIAAEALRALGTIRLPEATRALQTLLPIVHPELRSLAERTLRRLQFVGVEVAPLPFPDANWRALVSAVDGVGRQSVWFILENSLTFQSRFLNVLLNDRFGAVEAVGHRQVPTKMLPPRHAAGHLHDIALPGGLGVLLMLEASFDLGRRILGKALALNRETQIPIAAQLRLMSPWLWGVAGTESLPPQTLPDLSPGDDTASELAASLLEHPAFSSWTVRTESLLHAAEETLRHSGWDREVWVRRLAGEMFAEPEMARMFSSRLTNLSEWLLLAGEEREARLALATAQRLLARDPQDLPFIRALIGRDLELAVRSLRQKNEPILGIE